MSSRARLESLQLLVDLALLVTMATAGAAAFDQWTRLQQIEPDFKFSQTFMLACLNSGNGRAIKVGREAVVICAETE